MARWAVVTIIVYVLIVTLLFVPLVWSLAEIPFGEGIGLRGLAVILEALQHWQTWLVLAAVLLAQFLFVAFPIGRYEGVAVPRRAIWVPLVTTALLLAVLACGLAISIMAAIRGDHISSLMFWTGIIAATWIIWGAIFHFFRRATDKPTFLNRLTKWLVRGSIAELLVAVPCHIIVRHRNDCCAPGLTFMGMAAGIVVMAIAFGPAVLPLVDVRLKQAYARRKTAPQA